MTLIIKKLQNLASIKQERLQAQLNAALNTKTYLEKDLLMLQEDLAKSRQERIEFRNKAYKETLCDKVVNLDIEIVNSKLTKYNQQAESIIKHQQEVAEKIREIGSQISFLKKEIRYFVIKKEKYNYLNEFTG